MNNIFKNKQNSFDEYMKCITLNCELNMPLIKTPLKILDENLIIPTTKNFNDILKFNYNLTHLKLFAKNYKLKVCGNKAQLLLRVYSFLYFSFFITKIQKFIRKIFFKKYKSLHGPAINNRKLCTNTYDFVTMELIEKINFHQFYSFQDVDGLIYGFDINSLFNYFLKSKNQNNPYNRNRIPEYVTENIKSLIRLKKILKINIDLNFEDESINVSNEKAIEFKTLTLFQNIDALGNYSDPKWFLSLNKIQLIKLIKELSDIWNYRAQLTFEIKRNICPLNGDPFCNFSMSYMNTEQNINNIRKVVLEVLEKLVNCGVDHDSKALGAYYVLGCLTLLNENAAASLPWLFQSFSYF